MYSLLVELCAAAFGATRGGKGWLFVVGIGGLVAMGAALFVRWGQLGLFPVGVLFAIAASAAAEVFSARDALWRAARLSLDDPRQRPNPHLDERATAPTAVALRRLALAVDAARRGQYADATYHNCGAKRHLLRPDELRLIEAVRALVSLALADERLAAELAAGALPTGSDELDACLGRIVVGRAWANPDRLGAIDRSWAAAGVRPSQEGALPRLRQLVKLRVDPGSAARLGADEAKSLADEARAIGDEGFAAEIEMHARPSGAYR